MNGAFWPFCVGRRLKVRNQAQRPFDRSKPEPQAFRSRALISAVPTRATGSQLTGSTTRCARQRVVVLRLDERRTVYLTAFFVIQMLGGPLTPAFCIAVLSSAESTKAFAVAASLKSWVTTTSFGLSTD